MAKRVKGRKRGKEERDKMGQMNGKQERKRKEGMGELRACVRAREGAMWREVHDRARRERVNET